MDEAKTDPTTSEGTTRRFFLGAAAGLTGAALAATAAHAQGGDAAIAAAADRSFTGGTLNLLIDKQQAGALHSASGGEISSQVVLEKVGEGGIVKKHLAGIAYGEFDFRLDFPVSSNLGAEIQSMFDRTFDRFDGAFQMADASRKVVGERTFTNALITEVGFPACDAASKDTATLTVKVTPETIKRTAKPSGTVPAPPKVKNVLTSNFKLAIGGLDCTRVSRIEAITVKLAVQDTGSVDLRDGLFFLEIPDLSITLLESSAQTWFDWFDDFVVKGNNDDTQERSGTLSLLSSDLKTTVASISFSHLGIFGLEPTEDATGDSKTRRLRAQLYCEQMKLNIGGKAT